MTPDQIEDVIERTAQRTAEKIRDEVRGMFTSLGFDMDSIHDEQQMVAFMRSLHMGARRGAMAVITGALTTITGLVVAALWYFLGAHRT